MAVLPRLVVGRDIRHLAAVKVKYKLLAKVRHADYDADLWGICQALYAGGKALLGDKEVLTELFPRHNAEEDWVYEERCKRAFYIPYAGQVIDFIVASLFGQKITVGLKADAKPDTFWADWFDDLSRPGGKTCSLNELMRDQVKNALIKGLAWTMVDMPHPEEDAAPASLLEEQTAALDRPYAIAVDRECVTRWREDDSGELVWAIVRSVDAQQLDIGDDGTKRRESYMLWTRTDWTRFDVVIDPAQPMNDEDDVDSSATGAHSLGRVPLEKLELPEALWAMGKLWPLAREHLNKANALAWGEYKSAFQFLCAFLAPPEPGSGDEKREDPDRAVNQRVGQGRVMTLSATDKLEYISPDVAGFTEMRASCRELRDEMFRVVHHMSLAIENSASSLGRSADSKSSDAAPASVVLSTLGFIVRKHAERIALRASVAHGDTDMKWAVSGMEKFDDISLKALVDQEVQLELVSIPSPTFQCLRLAKLARRYLADDVTDDDMDEIREELKTSLSAEGLINAMNAKNGVLPPEPSTDGEPGGPGAPGGDGVVPRKKKKRPAAQDDSTFGGED